ncbi:MAG: tetratricopeptide repeat protein [Deltaproteobacteria bacterium]|jgi:TolA-binding protein
MGGKRNGTRQYLLFCAAGLILVMLAACASIRTFSAEQEGRAHLQREQLLLARGDFEGALQENRKVLAAFPHRPPGDEALFNMGLIYAHDANSQKDYRKAREFFSRLLKEFPESPRAEEARIWSGVLGVMDTRVEQDRRTQLQHIQLRRVRQFIKQGDFEDALQENRKVLAAFPHSPPGDEALFNMGLVYAHDANPKKDYEKALGFFARLQREFPESPRAEEARIWAGVLETMEKAKQIDIEIEAKKKELRR